MRHWRWFVVLTGVAALCALPVVVALRPVPASSLSTAEVVARVADSDDRTFEGLYESRGGLRLPDLGRFDDEIAPFTQTSRVRVWYQDPERWRTDELLIGAERSIYREPGGMWLWDSGTRRVVFSPREGDEPLRIPRLMDLSPAELGRRLLRESAGETVRRIDDRWVAGQASVGLRIEPADEASTIEAVELWVDPDTGVVTAVEIETGGTAPAFETAFADLTFVQPPLDVMQFDPVAAGQPVRTSATVDPVESVSTTGFGLPELPADLAGLPRRNDPNASVATYGSGMSVVNMFALQRGNLGRRINELPRTERPWGGEAIVVSTSLINVQIVTIESLDVVLSGTVDVSELDRIAGVLVEQGGLE
jgi:hypothetical protein